MAEPAGYADDPAVEDEAALWRRVPRQWVVKDENRGGFRPSSAAFQDSSSSPMSVLLEKIMTAAQRTPADALKGYEGHSLCAFTAGAARALGQQVSTRPEIPDEPAHGFVVGKKTGRVKNELSKSSRWVILNPSPL